MLFAYLGVFLLLIEGWPHEVRATNTAIFRHVWQKQDEIFNIAMQTLEIGNLVAVTAPFGLLFFVFGAGKIAGLIGSGTARTVATGEQPKAAPATASLSSRY